MAEMLTVTNSAQETRLLGEQLAERLQAGDVVVLEGELGAGKSELKYALYDSFPNEFDLIMYGGKRDLSNIKKSPLWRSIERDGITIYDKGAKTI